MSDPTPKKKSESRQATRVVSVRCTPEQYDEIASRAGAASVSGYVLAAALGKPKPKTANQNRSTRLTPAALEKLAVAFHHMTRIGANLNQLAKSANMDGWLEDSDVAELKSFHADFRAIGHCLKLALGVRDVLHSPEGSQYVITVSPESPLAEVWRSQTP